MTTRRQASVNRMRAPARMGTSQHACARARRALSAAGLSGVALAAGGCTSAVRFPLNRPSLDPYRCLEWQPTARGPVTARFFGVTSVLFQDSATAILSDGFVTRPGPVRMVLNYIGLARIAPNRARVAHTLRCLGVDSIAAVFTGHSHYDHALDAPVFAQLTGADLIGSASTANIGRGIYLPERSLKVIGHGDTRRYGRFNLTFVQSAHSPDGEYPGAVNTPLAPPARAGAWKADSTYSVFIRHDSGTILLHGSSGFVRNALHGRCADVVYLGIGTLGTRTTAFVDEYWNEVVRATGAKRVFLVHWDDPSGSIEKPLRALPYRFDALSTLDHLLRRAAADGVEVLLPVPWQPTDPFAGLTQRCAG